MLNDRGMMGDGVVDLRRIRSAVEDAGYAGLIEAEIFSDYWWAQPMDRVLATCVERYRRSSDIPSSRAKPPEGGVVEGPLCRCIVKIGPSATPRFARLRSG